jgi:hypothetical protein
VVLELVAELHSKIGRTRNYQQYALTCTIPYSMRGSQKIRFPILLPPNNFAQGDASLFTFYYYDFYYYLGIW